MIHLHIKGDMAAAFKAADAHQVELFSLATTYRDGGIADSYASAPDRFEPLAQRWFCEEAEIVMGYGYPAGTLLHYSKIEPSI